MLYLRDYDDPSNIISLVITEKQFIHLEGLLQILFDPETDFKVNSSMTHIIKEDAKYIYEYIYNSPYEKKYDK